ncbi:MAG: VOC family protein [Isosphaeraceae bacterium]
MSRIEHSAIFAADPATLKDFYVEAMGLRVVLDNSKATPPGYFLADDHGMALEIIGRPEGMAAPATRHVCHTAFFVDDYPAAKADLERRGIAFEAETEVHNANMSTGFFNDPQGNRCQIVWRPSPLVP